MKERPIPFSAPMVRALLAGTKTQTRRVVKLRALEWLHPDMFNPQFVADPANHLCPYGVPGDRLWVREAFRFLDVHDHVPPREIASGDVQYEAGPHDFVMAAEARSFGKLRPGMFMPRWASRILLEVTEVRVERLQDISEADALAEGIVYLPRMEGYGLPDGSHFHCTDPRISYWSLWDAINGQGAVEANPWCWAVSFRRITT